MEKLDGKTMDVVGENIKKLKEIFPEIIKENKIDFDKLQLILGENIEKEQERYEFTWYGKQDSIKLAQKQTVGTLRPDQTTSKEWDTTKNLYIEGDNLEILRLLQKPYYKKIKMVYIDPPYNTGNDFIYKDDFKDNIKNYKEKSGQLLVANSETSGRYHTDWLNMMYPRLKIAWNLIRDDGLIFISIDDNEFDNLKKLCNDVFGEENFVETLIWKKRATPPNDKNIGRIHEYIICYAKKYSEIRLNLIPRDEESIARYSNPDNDSRGPWVASDLSANGKGGRLVQSCVYPIMNPSNGEKYFPSEGRCWLFNEEKMNQFISEGRIGFREKTGAPYLKRYLCEVRQGLTLPTILTDYGFSSNSAAEIDKIFVKKGIFEYPKPTTLIKPLLTVGLDKDDIVLDFFSGSGTTADAVMQLNAEDAGKRRFIMIQLPESTDESSEAYKAGYKNICEIGKERIRRVGERLIKETGDKSLDVGFKVFKLDTSNIKEWDPNTNNITTTLLDMQNPIKEDRSTNDVLYEILIKYGVDVTVQIEETKMGDKIAYSIGKGYMFICLEDEIDLDIVESIAKQRPNRVVFKDAGFKDDNVKTNAVQILKKYGVEDFRAI